MAVESVVNLRNDIWEDYNTICAHAKGFGDKHKFEEFLTMRVIVNSAYFSFKAHGQKQSALIPYAGIF